MPKRSRPNLPRKRLFRLEISDPDGRRRPVRSYETEGAAREKAARWLNALFDGRPGFPQPVATITGPGFCAYLTVAVGHPGVIETSTSKAATHHVT